MSRCLGSRLIYLCFVLALCQLVRGQSTAAMRIGADFTTTALKATRLVSEYDGSPTHSHASTLVSVKEISDTLGGLSDLARSPGELQILQVLRRFALAKMANNDAREMFVADSWDAWLRYHSDATDDEKESARVLDRKRVLDRQFMHETDDRESACSEALSSMLRSGRARAVPECAHVEVPVGPEMQLH